MSRIKIAVIGNCQARPIADILEKTNENIEISCVIIVHLATDKEAGKYTEFLENSDYIITQVIADNYPCQFVTTKNILRSYSNKVVKINNLFYNGYFPDFRYLRTSKGNLAGPLTDYHSEFIVKCYQAGLSAEFTKLGFEQKNVRVRAYPNHIKSSLNELKARENAADVKICDYLEEQLNTNNVLFHTFNHPNAALLVKYANRILEYLSLTFDDTFSLAWEPLGQVKLPVVTNSSDLSITNKIEGFELLLGAEKISLGSKFHYELDDLISRYFEAYDHYSAIYHKNILNEVKLSALTLSDIFTLIENVELSEADLKLALHLDVGDQVQAPYIFMKSLVFYLREGCLAQSKLIVDVMAEKLDIFDSEFLDNLCDKLVVCRNTEIQLRFLKKCAHLVKIDDGKSTKSLSKLIDSLFANNGFSVVSAIDSNTIATLQSLDIDLSDYFTELESIKSASFTTRTIGSDIIVTEHPAEEAVVCRTENAAEEHYIYASKFGVKKATKVINLKGGYLTLDFSKRYQFCFYFFDGNSNFLPELSYGDQPFLDSKAMLIREKVAFCEDRFTVFNICHYLLDKIGRIAEFDGEDINSFLFFHQNPYTDYISKGLGVEQFNINLLKKFKYVTLKFDELFVSSNSTTDFVHPAQNFPKRVNQQITRLKSTINSGSNHERIFIDRNGGNSRTVINYEELKELLEEKQFQIVRLEELNVAEQLATFKNAKLVLSVHGAGLTNVMFAPGDVKLVELMPPLCASPSFWMMACGLGLDYYSILCEDSEYPVPDYSDWKHDVARFNRRNVIVPIEKLDALLNSII
ncbi:glycosyltransferase family 61 protein [Aestuariibacter sp. GS-14]|uniref:WcbI family polysaccharide biosynthesis putative acetyltransferase n=1 Tax=Aestuariibacter sp. GS-14 TaxID=2590670 RepID=UPI00112C91A2|nr:WcbI family polysaccharide biosynthesis putative acetyltransferase [Aestuariibacter sp. GS-14]TPV55130.1 glycosyltransferase family 61 protein [Aestuariibacter sp. GS-14]